MECKIEKITNPELKSIGAPKKIVVDTYDWSEDGVSGKSYSYHMSKERFEREVHDAYVITVDCVVVGKLSYYDFVDFNYMDCLSKRAIGEVANKANVSTEDVMHCIEETLNPLQEKIRTHFKNSEEYIEDQRNRDIIEKHKQNRKKFVMEYGLDGAKYDRCYNVFGQLMDSDYLDKLKEIMKEREEFSKNSKRKHKDAWRSYTESNFFGGGGGYYEEEDKILLAKFYKLLAKKYHPDSNPDIDTSKEMQLLNRLKKEWGL